LSEKGVPTPLVATMLRAPQSRMDILTSDEIEEINNKSKLVKKYSEEIDRESAYEILNKKIEEAANAATEQEKQAPAKPSKTEPSTTEVVTKSVLKVVTSATFIRGVFGVLSKILKK
jgi:transposase